jgi:hypothetical protein
MGKSKISAAMGRPYRRSFSLKIAISHTKFSLHRNEIFIYQIETCSFVWEISNDDFQTVVAPIWPAHSC